MVRGGADGGVKHKQQKHKPGLLLGWIWGEKTGEKPVVQRKEEGLLGGVLRPMVELRAREGERIRRRLCVPPT